MKYLNNILICIIFLAASGCCVLKVSDLTPFPPEPILLESSRPPVMSYDSTNRIYVVTKEMVNNAVQNKLFTEEVLKWRKLNNIP
jgi:hypothetical protein